MNRYDKISKFQTIANLIQIQSKRLLGLVLSLILFLSGMGVNYETRALAVSPSEAKLTIAYQKDWQKDLERKEVTKEKHGEAIGKYVEQAQQYNAENPNSKIDRPSTVGREVKSPRRDRKSFFKGLLEGNKNQSKSRSGDS
jgi:hypothetical protein